MPIVSQFYGILITMYYSESDKHKKPHLHARYAEYKMVLDLDGNIIEGKFPIKQRKMVEAWTVLHKEELQSLWIAIRNHNDFFKINPLQ